MAAPALLAVAILLAGCASAGRSSTTMTGASTPRQAVENFLAAARSQDLQAMSVVWGTDRGPARDIIDRDVLEKREIIMVCFFGAEKSSIADEATGQDGSRTFAVTLTKGSLTRQTDFTAVRGPSDRWYVENADILKVRDFCKSDKPDSLHFQGVVPRDLPQ
jgi:hypothetical protein